MPATLQTVTDQIIIDGLAAGDTQGHIAELVGLSRKTVNERAKKLRPFAEEKALDYFERNIPKATEINSRCLDAANRLYSELEPTELTEHVPLLNQAHRISDRILQAVGIVPSQAPSTVVQTFIQVNQVALLDPRLAQLFTPAALSQVSDPDVIEGEWEGLDVDASP